MPVKGVGTFLGYEFDKSQIHESVRYRRKKHKHRLTGLRPSIRWHMVTQFGQ